MSALDERQLILQAREGDTYAFRLLVERFMKQAYNIAYGVVRHHDDAEDLAQEAFVRVHRSLPSFRGDAEFSTWLYRIVMNLSLNRVRQRSNRAQHEVELTDYNSGGPLASSTPHEQPDMRMHIEHALHELPTLQRAVVILRHMNGLSTKQVSDILKCSEGTVKTHLHRGLKKMKKLLDYMQESHT